MLATKQCIFSRVAPGVALGSEALSPRTTNRKTLYRVIGPNERRPIGARLTSTITCQRAQG